MSEKGELEFAQRHRVHAVIFGTLVFMSIVCVILYVRYQPSGSRRIACGRNLNQLRLALASYAEEHAGHYPPAEQWCDLLAGRLVGNDVFRCPDAKVGPCNYAMNPNADPNSDGNVVLLFESKPGWNQCGGPELLMTSNHDIQGCLVAFADGHIEFVRADGVVGLKWRDEDDLPPELKNARRPEWDPRLKDWLENMVWYHRFSTEEVRLATGLTEAEIEAAQERFEIRSSGRPPRDANAPLLVLPYPGGRHPRIGFLEGAIDPQRETKFSVFTPWDPNSYAVLDIPEAIWSNLGLTYLAHTHVATIWTQQGIELPKLEWTHRLDGRLEIKRTLPNGLAFGVTVRPERDAVRMEMWLRNGTDQTLTDLRVQNCVMPKMAAGFAAQTNENKVFTNPYVACRSEDGRRWIITAWENCDRPWGNEDCPCFHSDPKFPNLEPGQEHRLAGWLSFYEGDNVEAEFARIEAIGWRLNQTSSKP